MSKITLLSGRVNNINYSASTSGTISRGEGRIRTRHRAAFRVENTPVNFPGAPNLAEGDRVTIAFMSGGIGAAMLRNDTTGVIYCHEGWIPFLRIAGGGLIFLGLTFLTTSFIFALILAVPGIWIFLMTNSKIKALQHSLEQNSPNWQSSSSERH
jgi:hypothetical protein